ncbi:WEB family protein [Sesbania bispinosa]|nr:WEB family protein [Sesbania bispinosa]
MEMEPQTSIISDSRSHNFSSTVDTSRPFTSVKEAVAIFGERLLVGEIYSPKPFSETESAYSPAVKREPSWRFSSPITMSSPKQETNGNDLFDTIKKLEAELEKTKVELKLLKERGSETEVALATLNAELHKNMSKLAQAEAAAAGKAAVATKAVRFEIERENGSSGDIREEEKKKRDEYTRRRRMEDSQTLSHILSLGENDHLFGGKKGRKSFKQKPIIPLVGDFFFKRKSSSTNHHNPLYASPF